MIVAIEDYTYLPDIPGAARNADAWERWLLYRGVPAPHIHLVVDRDGGRGGTPIGTREAIVAAAERAAAAAAHEGKLWVVFIGHGAPGAGDVRLLGTDTGRSAEGFEARGIGRAELLGVLEKTKAAATIAVLDTCFSGQGTSGEALLAEPLMPALHSDLADPEDTLELLATSRDQFAGPLPGERRPAFSYLVLGALRGWGDEALGATPDGRVTGREVVAYVKETLGMLVTGRLQEPSYNAESPDLLDLELAQGAEPGPDRTALRRALLGGDGGVATELAREESQVKSRWSAGSRRAVGGVLAGVGVAGMVGTSLAAPTDRRASSQAGLVSANVASWTLAGAGSALVVTSLQQTRRGPRRLVGGVLAGVGLAIAVGTEVALSDAQPAAGIRLADANAAGWALTGAGAAVVTTTFVGKHP